LLNWFRKNKYSNKKAPHEGRLQFVILFNLRAPPQSTPFTYYTLPIYFKTLFKILDASTMTFSFLISTVWAVHWTLGKGAETTIWI
jgi:hypothetical protein